MNCEEFRDTFDKMSDTGELLNKTNLPSAMVSHLEKCADCIEYFETMDMVQRALTNMQHEKIPNELYWRLIKLGEEHGTANWIAFIKPVALHALKILLPIVPLWIIAPFLPEPARFIIEMLTLIFGLALMFKKLGRRLITDRV